MTTKHFSEEARKRISDANKGKVTSTETKAKISAALKGQKYDRHKPFPKYAIYDGVEYTYAELTALLGFYDKKLAKIKQGRDKNHWNFQFI
jgi:hypothetical protein